MGRKSLDYVDFSETQNWNVAADYVKMCVMKHLYEADEYERLATFGVAEVGDNYLMDENTKASNRLLGIEWLAHSLMTLISNTVFAVKTRNEIRIN